MTTFPLKNLHILAFDGLLMVTAAFLPDDLTKQNNSKSRSLFQFIMFSTFFSTLTLKYEWIT